MEKTFGSDPQVVKTLRKAGIAGREALSAEERSEKSAAIVRKILASEEFRAAEVILLYKAIGGEVRLDALETAEASKEKHLAYPLCVSRTEMIALEPQGADAWMRGHYGITEPVRERSGEMPPEKIDLVICPCTAFDEACSRIGMGGGYYDRYLTGCSKAKIIAVAFEAQKAERIPSAPWDRPMQKVFTEDAVYER